METLTTYKFSEITRGFAEKAFQLTLLDSMPKSMEIWVATAQKQTLTQLEKSIITIIQTELSARGEAWNEQELQAEFIHPLLSILQFTNRKLAIAAFSERQLKKQIKQVVFQGKVDWMVASGKYDPEQPFFFIHEYKKGVGGSGDPVGQLLATMYVAQVLNLAPIKPTLFEPEPITYEDMPIYSCYVVGKIWRFVVLKDKDYYITTDYNATKTNELHEIVKLLKAQKQLIIERVTQNN